MSAPVVMYGSLHAGDGGYAAVISLDVGDALGNERVLFISDREWDRSEWAKSAAFHAVGTILEELKIDDQRRIVPA